MRVALVHSFYSSAVPSGENQVVLDQWAQLRDDGHEVLLLSRSTDAERALPWYQIRAGVRVATGWGPDPTERLRRFGPDVVHVHNLFPNLGSRWLQLWRGAVVGTVHNYRRLCANGLLFRDGQVCTRCPDGDVWAGVRFGCYRGSRAATLPLALRTSRGFGADPLVRRADRLVFISERSLRVHQRVHGFDDRFTVVPPFVRRTHGTASTPASGRTWLAAGRLSAEKGFEQLVREWPSDVALDIAGDGPLRPLLADLVGSRPIRLLGSVPRDDLRSTMPHYVGLVFPSLWFEGLPTIVLEALEAGLPVVARREAAEPTSWPSTGADRCSPTAPISAPRSSGCSTRALPAASMLAVPTKRTGPRRPGAGPSRPCMPRPSTMRSAGREAGGGGRS